MNRTKTYVTYRSKCWNVLIGFTDLDFALKNGEIKKHNFFMEYVLNFFHKFLLIWIIWIFIQFFIIVCVEKYIQTCLIILVFVQSNYWTIFLWWLNIVILFFVGDSNAILCFGVKLFTDLDLYFFMLSFDSNRTFSMKELSPFDIFPYTSCVY